MRVWPYTDLSLDVFYPYTAERREALGCTSLMSEMFPEGHHEGLGQYIFLPGGSWIGGVKYGYILPHYQGNITVILSTFAGKYRF